MRDRGTLVQRAHRRSGGLGGLHGEAVVCGACSRGGLEPCVLRTGVFADMNSAFWLAGNLLRTGVFADLNSAFWLAGVSVCSLQSLITTEWQLNHEDSA